MQNTRTPLEILEAQHYILGDVFRNTATKQDNQGFMSHRYSRAALIPKALPDSEGMLPAQGFTPKEAAQAAKTLPDYTLKENLPIYLLIARTIGGEDFLTAVPVETLKRNRWYAYGGSLLRVSTIWSRYALDIHDHVEA